MSKSAKPIALVQQLLKALGERIDRDDAVWLESKLDMLPYFWRRHVGAEHGRRGGVKTQAANLWLLDVTAQAAGRVPLSATDGDLREAAKEAQRTAYALAVEEMHSGAGHDGVRRALEGHCESWGIEPAWQDGEPGLLRMLDERWYLRKLRRMHARRAEGAAIRAGVVRKNLWPYASQDAVQRRQDQRKRNADAMARAFAEAADGERVPMADIVAGSLANQDVKRSELMVRIKGCDGYAMLQGWACEFWTITAPSRYHAQKMVDLFAAANPNYKGATPKETQGYISSVWAKWRAACARRGLVIAGLRTVEPHHDGTPHWHIICYGSPRDLRFARRLLRIYALRDTPDEPGAREHRFNYKIAEGGGAAAYAAAYVSKNIDGGGMEGERDNEAGQRMLAAVKRVDAWAAHWSIRQFQFFGMPRVGIWRVLRRVEAGGLPVGSMLERARIAADESDWCGFWLACAAGGLELVKQGMGRLTEYGDAAAPIVAGVREGGRRLMLRARDWVIHWGGMVKKRDGVGFDLPRSCVNNCTRVGENAEKLTDEEKNILRLAGERRRRERALASEFAGMTAAIFDYQETAAA